jgi:hypothetical protein
MAPSARSSKHALWARDAGLRKVSVATRVLVVGSIAASGAFASMAAWAQPGRSKARAANPTTGQTPLSSSGAGLSTATVPATTPAVAAGGGGDDNNNLNPPPTVPSTQYTPPATVPSTQYTPPTYQYTPPAYQYTPPVVSGAS